MASSSAAVSGSVSEPKDTASAADARDDKERLTANCAIERSSTALL